MLDSNRREVVIRLLQEVRDYSDEVYWHCLRVNNLSRAIGQALAFSPNEMTDLSQASLLHDYGKIFIPKDVLFKQGILTEVERKVIQQHVSLGVNNLEKSGCMSSAALDGVAEHHERLDGSGYPKGITEISIIGQILAVSDVFDAITHKRCYKQAYSPKYALGIVQEDGGKQFSDEIIQIITKVIKEDCSYGNHCRYAGDVQ